VGKNLQYEFIWQQNAVPGGTGMQQLTIPVNSVVSVLGHTYNASTMVQQTTHITSGTNVVQFARYDGTVEVTASQVYVAAGSVEF
jgi:hypothetical protein